MAQVAHLRPASAEEAAAAVAEIAGLNIVPLAGGRVEHAEVVPLLCRADDGWRLLTPGPGERFRWQSWPKGDADRETGWEAVADTIRTAGGWRIGLPDNARGARVDDAVQQEPRPWFGEILRSARGPLATLALASLVSNLLGLGVALFSMQVYDRIVPAQSMPTLAVLAIGAVLVLVLDLALRVTRSAVTDHFGKRADLKMSRLLFAHMLDIRSDARPKSAGSLVSQLREMEQLRELLTSANISVLLDLPFAAIFLGVIAAIGGRVVAVPLAAIPLIVLPGLLVQFPLARLSRQGMAESALRNALLMESVNRIEDIKSIQAEHRILGDWLAAAETSGKIALKQKLLRSALLSWSQFVQQLAYVGVLALGAYDVIFSGLSSGALIACSTLTSRTIAPLGQVSSVLAALQNARASKAGLDRLIALPTDHGRASGRYHRPALRGSFRAENLVYRYEEDGAPSLVIPHLSVEPGEKIGIIGRAGSGKTTLLRQLAGLSAPSSGRMLVDGTDLRSIDPADVRRNFGILLQGFDLFYGSIRDNLLAAAPTATDEKIVETMRFCGAYDLLAHNSKGLDLRIYENGVGLSGGQRQALLLTRTFLREPSVLLLDEPTEALDDGTEQRIIASLKQRCADRTVFLSTHRHQLLTLVDRLLVLEGGRIVADGPKAQVLDWLKNGKGSRGQAAQSPKIGVAHGA